MSNQRSDVGKSGTTLVSFVCQKCHQPLKLDHSFAELDETLLNELKSPLRVSHPGTVGPAEEDEKLTKPTVVEQQQDKAEGAEKPTTPTVSRKVIPPAVDLQDSDNGNGFTLLGDTMQHDAGNLGHSLKVHSELFDILAGESDVDHPLCEECTDTLLDMLDQRLKITEDECKDYSEFLEKLSTENKEEKVSEEALDSELKQLEEEEKRMYSQLEAIEAESEQIKKATDREKEKTKQLQAEEKRLYQEYNEYKRQLQEYEEAQRSVDNQLKYAQVQMDKLKKTNVFNATFHIWHSGHFGTINNFRLGRLPSVPVDWNEINAAWGQTVLLLHSLSNKMNLKLERYRLVPYGNFSYIESLSDKSKELPLYSSGGLRFFWDTKFDQAMVAFLDCLQQFKEEVEKGTTGFCLPYRMEKGKIEDTSTNTSYSIKIQFNSEEQWTKALKFMLTNLKWGLAYVSSQFANT